MASERRRPTYRDPVSRLAQKLASQSVSLGCCAAPGWLATLDEGWNQGRVGALASALPGLWSAIFTVRGRGLRSLSEIDWLIVFRLECFWSSWSIQVFFGGFFFGRGWAVAVTEWDDDSHSRPMANVSLIQSSLTSAAALAVMFCVCDQRDLSVQWLLRTFRLFGRLASGT